MTTGHTEFALPPHYLKAVLANGGRELGFPGVTPETPEQG